MSAVVAITFIAILLSFLATPLVRSLAFRFGWLDRPDLLRKFHSQPIPRVGGVAVVLSYCLALAFVLVISLKLPAIEVPRALARAVALVPAIVVIFLIGLLDDIVGLKPWQKIAGQILASIWVISHGIAIHFLRGSPLDQYLSLPLTILWLLACANGLNLLDGMDGLAAGVGLCASTTILLAALAHRNFVLALATAPLAGSLVGFLRYNFSPASIFLGDCGSLLVGFLLGCYGVLWSQNSSTTLGMTAPFIAMAVPLLDVCLSVVRRFLRNRSIFSADRGHIHHRLLEKGLSPRRAALLLYAFSCVAAILSLLQDFVQNRFGALIILLFMAISFVGVQHLRYIEFALAGRFFLLGELRRTIDVQVRLQQFQKVLELTRNIEEVWDAIAEHGLKFGFQGVRMDLGKTEHQYSNPRNPVVTWRLSVSLSHAGSLHFDWDPKAQMHPLLLQGFADAVVQTIESRIREFPSPKTPVPEYVESAAE